MTAVAVVTKGRVRCIGLFANVACNILVRCRTFRGTQVILVLILVMSFGSFIVVAGFTVYTSTAISRLLFLLQMNLIPSFCVLE